MESRNYHLEAIVSIFQGVETEINKFIQLFLKETPVLLNKLTQSTTSGNYKEALKILRTLKPTIMLLGMKEAETLINYLLSELNNSPDPNSIKLKIELLENQYSIAFEQMKKL